METKPPRDEMVGVSICNVAAEQLLEVDVPRTTTLAELRCVVRSKVGEEAFKLLLNGMELSGENTDLGSLLHLSDSVSHPEGGESHQVQHGDGSANPVELLLIHNAWTTESLTGKVFAKAPGVVDGLVYTTKSGAETPSGLFSGRVRFELKAGGDCIMECDAGRGPKLAKGGKVTITLHFQAAWSVVGGFLEIVSDEPPRLSRFYTSCLPGRIDVDGGAHPAHWGSKLSFLPEPVEFDQDNCLERASISLDTLIPGDSQQLPEWVPHPPYVGSYAETRLPEEERQRRSMQEAAHSAYLDFAGKCFCEVPSSVFGEHPLARDTPPPLGP